MKQTLVALVILVILGAGVLFFASHNASQAGESETVKIGAILPLTGPLGDLGQEINRGALLAVEDMKAKGVEVEYIPEDDAFDPKQSVSAANKLLNVDKVEAVFTAIGEESKPVASLFNAAKIPLLVAWDSNEELKKAGPYIFTIGFSTEKDGALMADYAYDVLKLRTIAVIAAIDPVMDIMAPAFVDEFKSKGGTIVSSEKIQPDATDFRTVIAKTLKAKPEAIYIGLIPPENATFLPQLRAANFPGAVLSADGLIQSDIEAAGTAANGVYYTNIYALNADAVTKKYTARFGSAPADSALVSFGYDSMGTLLAGHTIAHQKNIDFRTALTMTSYKGLGTDINLNGGQFSERVERVFHIENGEPVLAQ